MPSFAKPIFLSLAGALGLYGLGVLFANMYLQSRGVQGRIRNSISQAAGLPVTIERTYYTPWSGLAISGLAIPPVHPAMESPLVSIESVRVSLSLTELFQGRIHIKDIVLHRPRIVSRQTDKGSWKFDETPEVVGTSTPPTHEPPKIAAPSAATPVEPPIQSTPKPAIIIDAFHIIKGSAVFYMANGSPGLELSGVSLESLMDGNGTATGTCFAKSAILGSVIKPTDLNGSFTWSNNRLTMPNINALWAGGLVSALFELNSEDSPSFSATIAAVDVSLATLAADAGFDPEGTDGRLKGTFSLSGQPGIESTYTGAANVEATDARMLPIEPIRQLGDMFQIKELQSLEIESAQAKATIANGKINIETIAISTENVLLDAQGNSSFSGDLNLKARFHVSEKLRRKTGGILGNKFTPSDTAGFSHMPFAIAGTMQRPKTDLLDKIVGVRIQRDIGGLLKNFLQFPSTKKKPSSASPKPGS